MAMNGTGKEDECFRDKRSSSSSPAEEKLQWLFKLYDKDMNGEIVQEELEDIFIKMCKIVEKTELDHIKKHAKIAEEERKRKALGGSSQFSLSWTFSKLIFEALEKQREREMRKEKDEMNEDKNKVAVMYSERKKRLQTASINHSFMIKPEYKTFIPAGNKKKKSSVPRKKKVGPIRIIITDVDEEEVKKDKEKVKLLKSVADELCQPHR